MTTNPPFVPTATSAAAHAFLAPSAAARWVVCPGSALMESRFPEQGDKAAAEEGTAAHWVFAQLLDGWAGDQLLADGKTESGHPVTREMVEAATILVDDVRATVAAALGPVTPVIEQRVAIPRVHAANWGTPDVRLWVPDPFTGTITLYVWDFKYGHKHVDAFENYQLIDYAAGILDERRDVPEDRITVVFRVVQPRSYHRDGPVREWRVRAPDLAGYVFRLQGAADEATQPTPVCNPQPDACENCNARHACEALQRAAYRGMDIARQAQADALSPAALGLELRYLKDASKLMEARLTGLEAQAESLIRQAVIVPHWQFKAAGSRKVWNKPTAEVLALGDMLGLKLAKEPEPVTPTQALAAGFPASLLGAYAFTPPGAMKLAPDDGSDARKVFAKSP
jgi:hypothetical protein